MRWNTGIRSLLFLMWVSWTIIGQPGNTSAECSRDKLSFSFVRGHDLTMQDIVWVLLQGHRSVSISRHFLLQAYSVSVPCENSSAETTVAEGGQNLVAGLWGHTLSEKLTTWADFQLCLHRLLMSTGCKSSHSGFLYDSRTNGGHFEHNLGLWTLCENFTSVF